MRRVTLFSASLELSAKLHERKKVFTGVVDRVP
jgi:hypothetical protein